MARLDLCSLKGVIVHMNKATNYFPELGTILLTGASGFVGGAILDTAQQLGLQIRPVYRSIESARLKDDIVLIPDLYDSIDWFKALQGVDVVIHAAARAHIMREDALDPLAEYRRVNVEGTLNLARQAATAGVRRFLFISSIKVNGEATSPGHPFTAGDTPAPEDAYGVSKAEAEEQLKLVAQETGMAVTIIRPPLIYGPGVKGNFASLITWVRRGLPLPLGGVTNNRRSLVGLDNLVDLILVCADHPKAANQIFLISDGEDLSTTELLRKIGKALGRPARLLWVPAGVIYFMAGLVGKKRISQRLLGSLQVDIHKTCELLDWKPLVAVDEELRKTVK
jgi:nucleoside-diphosphate-sugar epimerase